MTLAVAAGFGVGLCVIGQAMGIAWIVHSVVALDLSVMQTAPTIAAVAALMVLRGLLQYLQQRAAGGVGQLRRGLIPLGLFTPQRHATPPVLQKSHAQR
ncbi:MAG: hypothetical protein RLN67_09610, partial [Algiphilus sp.]